MMNVSRDSLVDKHAISAPFEMMSELPWDLMYHLAHIEEDIENGFVPASSKIAVFDLDDTLMIGNVNETLIVQLMNEGFPLPMSWSSYRTISGLRHHEACLELAASMDSLPLLSLVKATHKILSAETLFLEVEGNSIPVPRPHPIMLSLVRHLFRFDYRVYVITSGNEIAARIIASQFFNIPGSNVFGLRQRIDGDVLTNDLLHPVPVDNGKVEAYLRYIGAVPPLITGGCSPSDIPLLRLTDPYGLCLWLGDDRLVFESARARIGGTQQFRFVELGKRSQLEQNPAKIG